MGQSAHEVRQDIERTREDLDQDLDALGEKMSPRHAVQRRTDRMRSRVTSIRERVMGSAEEAGSSFASGAAAVRDKTSDMASTVGGAASDATETIKAQAEGNPIAVGVVAFGLGALAATILPDTNTERSMAPQLREHVVEPVKETATDVARDVSQELKDSARGAADRVKETAQRGANEVKEDVRERASDIRDEADQRTREIGSGTQPEEASR